jgi:hypothetical protein
MVPGEVSPTLQQLSSPSPPPPSEPSPIPPNPSVAASQPHPLPQPASGSFPRPRDLPSIQVAEGAGIREAASRSASSAQLVPPRSRRARPRSRADGSF